MRRRRAVTFTAIRLRGPGFKPRPGQKFETRFPIHSHSSGGEGVSPVQGEAITRRYIKPEYFSYMYLARVSSRLLIQLLFLSRRDHFRQYDIHVHLGIVPRMSPASVSRKEAYFIKHESCF